MNPKGGHFLIFAVIVQSLKYCPNELSWNRKTYFWKLIQKTALAKLRVSTLFFEFLHSDTSDDKLYLIINISALAGILL